VPAEIPRAWVGLTVVVALLEPSGGTLRRGGYDTGLRPVQTSNKIGVLEGVTDLGIYGDFRDSEREAERAASVFYPWSAVLGITPAAD
jgi:hypothetical protein